MRFLEEGVEGVDIWFCMTGLFFLLTAGQDETRQQREGDYFPCDIGAGLPGTV